MVKHPKDRLARRSTTAKALESRLFRQQIKNDSRKRRKAEIEAEEAEEELKEWHILV